MKQIITTCVAVIAGAAVWTASSVIGVQDAPFPPTVTVPAAQPTPRPVARRVVDLDRPGVPIQLDPELPVTINVRALVPAGRYRGRVLRPDFGQGWRLMNTPQVRGLPINEEGCRIKQEAFVPIFQAPDAEEAERRIAAFRAIPESVACPRLEPLFESQLPYLSPEVAYGIEPIEGVDLKLTIEQLDEQGAVLRTLEWPLVPPASVRIATETEWIVTSIAKRIATLAGSNDEVEVVANSSGPFVFDVKRGAGAPVVTIDVSRGPWDVDPYVAFVRAYGVPRVRDVRPSASNRAIEELVTPVPETLIATNTELGLALRAEPLNPATHESAALLLTSLALTASPSGFEDIRPLLNRATAHLAVAAAGRARPGVEGEVARLAMDVLERREVKAARGARALRARGGSRALLAWTRALEMRASGDWRVYPARGATLLEQLAKAHALRRSWSSERAAEFMAEKGEHGDIAAWRRAVLGDQVSVELGHALVASRLPIELAEAGTVAAAFAIEDLTQWLTSQAPREEGREPVSSEVWARFIEGAVTQAAASFNRFVEGLPPSPAPARFREDFVKEFGASPTVQALAATWLLPTAEGPPRCLLVSRAIQAAPFRLSAWALGHVRATCRSTQGFPNVARQIQPFLPPGTAFDVSGRLESPGILESSGGVDWPAVRAMMFYEPTVLGFAVNAASDREPEASDYQTFVQERGYSLALLRDWRFVVSSRGRPDLSLEPGRAACRLDSSECWRLIDLLVVEGHVEEAFTLGSRVFAAAELSVAAANEVSWMVDQCVLRGDIAQAREIARKAARTGAYVGLLVRARLTDRLGDFEAADRLFAEIDERYDTMEAAQHAVVVLARSGADRQAIGAAILALGPPGVALLPGGPVEGYLDRKWVQTQPLRRAQAEKMGLRLDDVIIAANGYKVSNSWQFFTALGLSDDQNVEITVVSESRPGPVVLRGELWHPRHSVIGQTR